MFDLFNRIHKKKETNRLHNMFCHDLDEFSQHLHHCFYVHIVHRHAFEFGSLRCSFRRLSSPPPFLQQLPLLFCQPPLFRHLLPLFLGYFSFILLFAVLHLSRLFHSLFRPPCHRWLIFTILSSLYY